MLLISKSPGKSIVSETNVREKASELLLGFLGLQFGFIGQSSTLALATTGE